MSQKETESANSVASAYNNAGARIVTVDYARYARHLENADWSDAQKKEFIDTLWSIIVAFVDLGFGVHPLQHTEQGDGTTLLMDVANHALTGSGTHGREHAQKIKTEKEEPTT